MSTHNICFYGELTKITLSLSSNTLLICFTAMRLIIPPVYEVPYNGIFSRRQIFAVLSKKYGDYFSRILIFIISILFRENRRVGGTTRLSLYRTTVRKENLRPKVSETQRIKRYLQSDRQTNKNNIFTFRRLKTMTVQNKTMKCLSCLLVTLCHTTLFAIK